MPHLCTAQPGVTLPLTRCSAGLSSGRARAAAAAATAAAAAAGRDSTHQAGPQVDAPGPHPSSPGLSTNRQTSHTHQSRPTRALALPDRSAVGLPLDPQLLSPPAALSLTIIHFVVAIHTTDQQTERQTLPDLANSSRLWLRTLTRPAAAGICITSSQCITRPLTLQNQAPSPTQPTSPPQLRAHSPQPPAHSLQLSSPPALQPAISHHPTIHPRQRQPAAPAVGPLRQTRPLPGGYLRRKCACSLAPGILDTSSTFRQLANSALLSTSHIPATYHPPTEYTLPIPTGVSVGPRHQVPTQPTDTQPPAASSAPPTLPPATRFTNPPRPTASELTSWARPRLSPALAS